MQGDRQSRVLFLFLFLFEGEPPVSTRPPTPSRRTLLRAMAALPASAVLLGELPGLAGTALAAAPPSGSATRYTIVPFLNSNDGTVNVYQSDDATDFRLLRSSAYTPPSNRIRDASVFKHTDGYYYLTYTTHTWQDVSTTIGFARSSDRVNWTFLYDYTVPISQPVPRVGAGVVRRQRRQRERHRVLLGHRRRVDLHAVPAEGDELRADGMEFAGRPVRDRLEPHRHVHREDRLDVPRLHEERDDQVHRVRDGLLASPAPTPSPGPATGRAGAAIARARR